MVLSGNGWDNINLSHDLKKQLTKHHVYDILIMRKQDICGSGSVVEHLLAKEKVAGSIPVSRSQLSSYGDVAKW